MAVGLRVGVEDRRSGPPERPPIGRSSIPTGPTRSPSGGPAGGPEEARRGCPDRPSPPAADGATPHYHPGPGRTSGRREERRAMSRGTVTKAVIPAAGLGTRFLPATKAQPKEMLPVVDKPAIQYVVEEAVRAGIDD